MAEVRVLIVVPAQLGERGIGLVLTLELRGSGGQEVDAVEWLLHAVGAASAAAAAAAAPVGVGGKAAGAGSKVRGVRVRGGHVWRGDVGVGRGARDCLWGWWHAAHASVHAAAHGLFGDVDGLGVVVLLAFAPPRVWVVVDSRVAGELVGSAEAFCAAGELAAVRLLARVGADVPGLVLQAVKGLLADGTLVGARQVLALVVLRWRILNGGRHEADAGRGHCGVGRVVDGRVEERRRGRVRHVLLRLVVVAVGMTVLL